MNKQIIIGNLTADPEKRATPNGVTVTSFTVAVGRRFTKDTDYFKVNAWRQLGEFCAKYLTKGRKVCVIGELQPRTYDGKDGKTRFSLDISADEVEFLSPAETKSTSNHPEKPVSEWDDISSKDLPWGD